MVCSTYYSTINGVSSLHFDFKFICCYINSVSFIWYVFFLFSGFMSSFLFLLRRTTNMTAKNINFIIQEKHWKYKSNFEEYCIPLRTNQSIGSPWVWRKFMLERHPRIGPAMRYLVEAPMRAPDSEKPKKKKRGEIWVPKFISFWNSIKLWKQLLVHMNQISPMNNKVVSISYPRSNQIKSLNAHNGV